MDIVGKRKEMLFTREEIQKRVEELGKEITKDYEGKKILAVSLLKGGFIFAADLVREIDVPVITEFMVTASYGHGEESTGNVKILYDLDKDLEEYDVLVIDDIVDSGNTMDFVLKTLKNRNPKSLKSCVLLDKPSRRQTDLEVDYVGITIPDKFVVGYGMNYGDYYRNTPYIFAFEDDNQ